MAYEPKVVEQEEIRQQMEETRASLADKLETLEQHVLDTVQETTSAVANTAEKVSEAVEGTVESVKETVETVKESVKETFDIRLQTERHPWAVVGGSVAVGFAIGYLAPRGREGPAPGESEQPSSADYIAAQGESARDQPSYLMKVLEPELERLKTFALERLRGLVHDLIAGAVPGYDPNRQEQ